MIQKLIQRLPAIVRVHRRVYQLPQVFNSRESFWRVFLLQLFDVPGAVNQKLEKLRRVSRCPRSPKSLRCFFIRRLGGGDRQPRPSVLPPPRLAPQNQN